MGWCGKGWVSWSAGEGVRGSLGGFLVDLARNPLRAERHPLAFTCPYVLPLTCFAGQGGPEHIQICLEGAQAVLASPVPVWWQQNICPPGACYGCAGHVTSQSKSERWLLAAVGQHRPRYSCPPLRRETGWEQVQEGLCPHALTFPTGLCVQVPQHMASLSFWNIGSQRNRTLWFPAILGTSFCCSWQQMGQFCFSGKSNEQCVCIDGGSKTSKRSRNKKHPSATGKNSMPSFSYWQKKK